MGRKPEHHPALLPVMDAESTLDDVKLWLEVAPVDDVSKRRALRLLERTRGHQRTAAVLLNQPDLPRAA